MEQQTSDRELRLLFERNVPPVDADEVWRGVSREIGLRRPASRPRRAWLRVAMTVATVALLVAGVGVGALEAVTHLGKGERVIVIGGTETPMTTAAAAVTTTSTTAVSGTPAAGSAEFGPLLEAWRTKGIVPLSVERDPSHAKGLIVRVPADKATSPEGIFYNHQLQRQAFLTTHQENLPFDWIQVYKVDASGRETLDFGMNPQAGMAFAKDWISGETLDLSAADAKVQGALDLMATSAGVQHSWKVDEGPDGRTMEMTVTLPADNEIPAYRAFLEQVFATMEKLNHAGCHVAVLELSVNDLDGGPILRDVVDFELQSGSAWWSSNDFTPPGYMSRPSLAPTTEGT